MCLPIWRHDQPSSCNSSILDRSSEEKAILLVREALAAPLPVGPLAALRRACVVAGQEIYAARPDVASPAQWTGVTQICRYSAARTATRPWTGDTGTSMWVKASTDAPSQEVLHIQRKS